MKIFKVYFWYVIQRMCIIYIVWNVFYGLSIAVIIFKFAVHAVVIYTVLITICMLAVFKYLPALRANKDYAKKIQSKCYKVNRELNLGFNTVLTYVFVVNGWFYYGTLLAIITALEYMIPIIGKEDDADDNGVTLK